MAKLKFYMLIGVPGSGKSTWTKTFLESSDEEYAILSTDGYIEREAQVCGESCVSEYGN
jgi:adenylate kinase family enzyme